MAQRRMFSLEVCDTDKFLDMSASAQALYFHLGLHGDDDGFVASPKRIARAAGCNDDDLRLLAAKGFIIPFDSGVVVITDWNVNNTLKNDRYHETVYQDEKSKICRLTNGKYALASRLETDWNQDVSNLEPEHNITKLNLTKLRKEGADKPPTHSRFVPPTVEEAAAYCKERGNNIDAERFVDFYTANGWKQGAGKPIKDWRAAVRTWERRGNDGAKSNFNSDGRSSQEIVIHGITTF